MRRAAATRPKKTPMKQANSSLVDIARTCQTDPFLDRLPADVLCDVTSRERWRSERGGSVSSVSGGSSPAFYCPCPQAISRIQ
jgi:hypothetical protein